MAIQSDLLGSETMLVCHHCGLPAQENIREGEQYFCCQGCLTANQLLTDTAAFCQFPEPESYKNEDLYWTDLPGAMGAFEEGKMGSAILLRFRLPAIHCAACIQILEKLYLRNPGIVYSEVKFLNKEILLAYEPEIIQPSALIHLLGKLGYPPELSAGNASGKKTGQADNSNLLLIRLAVAAFCAGNIMLLSFPEYFGLEDKSYLQIFSWLNLFLSLPAIAFSAWPYWNSVRLAIQNRQLNLDVPIAVGMAATFILSLFEIIGGSGAGYLDSLTGLILFLLAGRWVQDQTYRFLSFERDYRSYFPLSVIRIKEQKEMPVLSTEIVQADVLKIRHGEIIPCDGILMDKEARFDTAFINGESIPLTLRKGDKIQAGARLISGRILMEAEQPMQRSKLVQLWNNSVFGKKGKAGLQTFSDQVARYFTPAVLLLAFSVAVFWYFEAPEKSLRAFVSVLIVACPCTLALAYPVAMGNTMRLWGKRGFFLKNAAVAETLGNLNALVFDKTGTLGEKAAQEVLFKGPQLEKSEVEAIASLVSCSTHPLSQAILQQLKANALGPVESFKEIPGSGLSGRIGALDLRLGSAGFAGLKGTAKGETEVHITINGVYKGYYEISAREKPFVKELVAKLKTNYKLALISGDKENQTGKWQSLFGESGGLCLFRQSPEDKLKVMEDLKSKGLITAMIGDGLNDAGALKAADCGIAIAANSHQFTPGSDAILLEKDLASLPVFLKEAKNSIRVVKVCFTASLVYNTIGFSVAASGALSPLFAALLMPASSLTVVGIAWLGTNLIHQGCGDYPD